MSASSPKASPYCGCLFFTSGALARGMNRLAEAAFAPTGIAPSYAFLLMTVNREPGISPGEAAEQIALTPSTVTRLVEKLEAKRLLEREADGRHVRLHPTPASLELDPTLRAAWSQLFDRYQALLGPELSQTLTQQSADAIARLDRAG